MKHIVTAEQELKKKKNQNTKFFLYVHSVSRKAISLHLCSRGTELLLYSELHKLT